MRTFFLIALTICAFGNIRAQEIPPSDWENYFNAVFLPSGDAMVAKSLAKIEYAALREDAQRKNLPDQNLVLREQEESNLPPAISVIQNAQMAEWSGDDIAVRNAWCAYQEQIPLHPLLYDYARSVLQSVSQNGVLLTQGHQDTYPLRVLQSCEGYRSDVVVVHLSWFVSSDSYRQQIAKRMNAQGSFKNKGGDIQRVEELRKVSKNSIYLAMTLSKDVLMNHTSALQASGLVFAFEQAGTTSDTGKVLRQVNWDKVLGELPPYANALLPNYLAAVLIDQQQTGRTKYGSYPATELKEALYERTGLRKSGENYLQDK